jgi:hypothetical protein
MHRASLGGKETCTKDWADSEAEAPDIGVAF